MPNILIDQYNNSTTPGDSFGASSIDVTIATGVLVGASQAHGVFAPSTYNSDSLANNGNILSGTLRCILVF